MIRTKIDHGIAYLDEYTEEQFLITDDEMSDFRWGMLGFCLWLMLESLKWLGRLFIGGRDD